MTKTRAFLLLGLGMVVLAYLWPRPQFDVGNVLWPLHLQCLHWIEAMVGGKRVLVTGASSGIGEQLAYHYARAGASVFITARRAALLEKVIGRCRTLGSPGAQFGLLSADMEDMAQTTSVIETAVSQLGGLDQLVLDHAYLANLRPVTNSQKSFDILKKTMDVNMRSFAHLALEAIPHLRETHGSIGVVNSIGGKIATPLMVPYSASKFAVDGFFTGLQGEVQRYNISITMAVIGAIETQTWLDRLDDVQTTYKGAINFKEDGWPLASAKDCAYEIMRGTTMREREIYFPDGFIHYVVLFRELVVRVMDFGGVFAELLNLNPNPN